MKETSTAGETSISVDERYTQWKSLVPVLYEWLANHNLVWPSLSCRWGPQLEQATYKNRQRLYLSEQTDGSVPNTLVIANCEVVKPRVAAAEHIAQFNEEARSPFVKKFKTIIHPGEVNRIRELPQNSKIVATHTDSPDVLIWDVETQPNRHAVLGTPESRPDSILTGHKDNAEFALAMCPTEPLVLSGGWKLLFIIARVLVTPDLYVIWLLSLLHSNFLDLMNNMFS
ncbi:WD-40 repeat-containing protein MSI4-like isoform X1 [Vitis riparia]|uniref:WD-40 repeat-containing protein MSI4-like isoform X1 n=1 Tax=Vitis riparia TaxID=96939 RepID=UPI00155AF410|nr:WD-40 repeat-containing protein MSI4-like isoform X1 [Vitis riparia]